MALNGSIHTNDLKSSVDSIKNLELPKALKSHQPVYRNISMSTLKNMKNRIYLLVPLNERESRWCRAVLSPKKDLKNV